jgi:hypothetical protein
VHNYYADASQNIYASALSNTPTFPSPPPSVDWTGVAADSGFALSDPTGASDTWACTNGKSLRAATFDLTRELLTRARLRATGSSPGTAQRLTINGGIYISGNLITQNNANVVYSGLGAIYVGGTITFGNNTAIWSAARRAMRALPDTTGTRRKTPDLPFSPRAESPARTSRSRAASTAITTSTSRRAKRRSTARS